ncbi:MAG: hypothetical protein EKK37_04335 [Sphingobacteriales bacterium]|jgi:hypothetical protein|nr:MAG: hypothetical protein EKK37_04335 [Sphingobacteriales bacterium]
MKKYLGIIVVILAVSVSAFTTAKKSNLVGNSYTYDLYGMPGQDDPVNLNNGANYTYVGTSSLSCTGTAHRCGVQDATDDGFGHPDFTKSYTIRIRN